MPIFKRDSLTYIITEGDTFEDFQKDVSFLSNTAIASAKVHRLILEEKERDVQIRSTIHILFSLPTGQLKSTLLNEISEITKQPVITETSRAGLVGAIDTKTWSFIEGQAWNSRNSLLLLDEFTFGKKNKEGWEVFLQLLENQRYGKRIGIFAQPTIKEDSDLYIKVDKGSIDIKTRFSCVIATMKRFESRRGEDFRAFVTRTIPYRKDLSLSILQMVAKGKKIFLPQEYSIKTESTVPSKIYNKIEQFTTAQIAESSKISLPSICKEVYLRSIGDISRVYAIHQTTDYALWKRIIEWKISSQLIIGKYFRDAANRKKEKEELEKLMKK